MKLGLINSAWAQAGKDTAWGLSRTKEIGFDCVDIFTDPLTIDVRERRLLRDECFRLGLPIVSLPCVALGLGDFNASVRRFHIERAKAFLDLAYELRGENVLLVLGEYIWDRQVIPPKEQWDLSVQSCRELGDYAAGLGLKIALELEPFALSLLGNVDAMARFLDEVNHPAVGANIDISHLVLAKVPPEEVGRLAGRTVHVHISDCDGKDHGDLPPGRGVVPFEPYLQAIKHLGFDGTIAVELEYAPDPAGIEDWVQEAFSETEKRLRVAGLRG